MGWTEEQNAVLNARGNLLVSASAGSGKTTVLVEKVLRLIESGADIRRILLMTFTRAAAKEMREKLVKKLYASGKSGNENAAKQLENLPFAHIETIDSFCAYLMKKYFNVAGCDPAAVYGDESALAKAKDECYDKVFDAYFEKAEEDFLQTAAYFRDKQGYEKLRKEVYKLSALASNRPDKEAFYRAAAGDNAKETERYYLNHRKLIVPYLLGLFDELFSLSASAGYDIMKEHPEYAEYRERLASALQAETVGSFLATLSVVNLSKIPKNKKIPIEITDCSGTVREHVNAFLSKVSGDAEAYHAPKDEQQRMIKRTFVAFCKAVEKEYEGYKRRRKTVEVADAIRYALIILRDETARKDIQRAFDYVFVDEYQDTNFMQEALIDGVSDGNVTLVGDLKQAIYKFRLAEPAIFMQRQEEYAHGEGNGQNLFLNKNFRSCKGILDFTNRVCDRVMTREFCGVDYKGTSRLRYGETVPGEENPVEVCILPAEEKSKTLSTGTYSVRKAKTVDSFDRESIFVAQRIQKYVKKGRLPQETDDGKSRSVSYGDIAVLVRKAKEGRQIADALEKRGVPYYFLKEDKSAFPEREILVDTLRVALNALDDVALYNVAVSPVGRLTEKEICEIKNSTDKEHKRPLWESLNAYNGNERTVEKIRSFLAFAEEMRVKCAYKTAEELLTIALERSLDAYLLGKDVDKLAKLNAFVCFVGGQSAHMTCEEFLYYYDNVFGGNKPPVKKDAVAIMTMHGSKGLEFPIVVLPFTKGSPDTRPRETEADGDLGLAVNRYDEENRVSGRTFDSHVLRMKRMDEERQEEARLMYVAFTRARYFLTVTGEDCKVPLNVFEGASVMQWILFAAQSDENLRAVIRRAEPEEEVIPEKKRSCGKAFCPDKLFRKYAYEKETTLPAKQSVSAILASQEGYGVNPFPEGERGASSSAEKGTAVHAMMQYVDYGTKTLEELTEQADALVREGTLTAEERKLLPMKAILDAVQSDLVQSLRDKRVMREQPFMMYLKAYEGAQSKTLVQVVIDLLADEGDGYVIVDFKTGGANAETLRKRYAKQLDLYAQAVESILHKPVKKKILYGIESRLLVEIGKSDAGKKE